MYKIPKLNNIGSLLARSKNTNVQLYGHRQQAINTSSNDVKPKSKFLFYATTSILTGVLGTAGIVVYSKYDPKFRELLTNNVPGSDKFIKICLFEDQEFVDQTKRLGGRIVCKVAQQVKSVKESISSVGGQTESFVDKSTEQIKSVFKSLSIPVPLVSHNEEKEPKEKQEQQQIDNQQHIKHVSVKIEPTKSKEESQQHSPASVILPPHQYTLDELETEILKKSSLGIDALKNATVAVKEYSENVCKLIESATEKIDPNLSLKLQQLEDKKNEIYAKVFEDAKKYRQEINEKQKLINNLKFETTPEKLVKIRHRTNEVLEELANANVILENEEHKMGYIKKYISSVNEAQASLIKEFESLFPGSDITQHKFNVKNNDFDIFLLYALNKLNYYQDKLSKQEATLDRKINNAMNADFLNVETMNEMNSRLNSEIHALDEQFNSELSKFNIKVTEDLQKQLKDHTQAHADLVTKAVDFTKEEFESRVRNELSAIEKLEHQKYQSQLDSLKSDLQRVINNLKEQAEKEKMLFSNLAIWEECESLYSSLANSDYEGKIIIRKKINAIKEFGASNSMVKQILNAIPLKALEHGVFSKYQLKEDFKQVEKRVYQTALIPDDTFNLPLMAFSFLASWFVVRHSHISSDEVNNETFIPSELNTYEIVERARYCVDRDDISQALRYLNLLTGCSKVVAKEWIKEAIVFLETKQAIDLLMSHATITSYSAAHST